MQYLLLIYENEADWAAMPDDEKGAIFEEYMAFSRRIHEAGQMLGGEARVRDGRTLTTDGPFAETREQLGGFYFVEADDLDQAIALAAQIPGAKMGSIEVRPILPTPKPE